MAGEPVGLRLRGPAPARIRPYREPSTGDEGSRVSREQAGNWGLQKGGSLASRVGGGSAGVSTHPVTFHTHVTFEPRKAILALRKMGTEEAT